MIYRFVSSQTNAERNLYQRQIDQSTNLILYYVDQLFDGFELLRELHIEYGIDNKNISILFIVLFCRTGYVMPMPTKMNNYLLLFSLISYSPLSMFYSYCIKVDFFILLFSLDCETKMLIIYI
jgi:hypothetical protein